METKSILIGENISRIRRKKNMTQAELANRLGVSQSAINQWEKGQRKAKLETVIKMSKVLSCSPKEILSEFEKEIDCIYSINDVFKEIKRRMKSAEILEKEARENSQYQKASEAHGAFVELVDILKYFGQET